jgi:hypothetical protein
MADDATIKALGLREYAGFSGLHTRDQAAGAIPNGARVEKVASAPGDTHQDGAAATILGSIHHPKVGYGYFVAWDTHPRAAVFVAGSRVKGTGEAGDG